MLMGRVDEQRTLDALMSGARVGRSGVLVLSGDAGIGKSALLSYARSRADGFKVLTGVGTASEHDLPFAGLARVLQPLLGAIDDLPEPQAHALGVALAMRTEGVADRFAVSAAALTLVTRAAESGPLALVVDDAHLLDTPSAQALAFVARRVLVDAVVVLVAVRPRESEIWAGLPTLDVGPLDAEAADRLVDEAAPGLLTAEQRRRLMAMSAGNPLAIRALAQEPEGLTGVAFGQTVTVPVVVADAFSRRTAGLSPKELRVLQMAVIADGDVPTIGAACVAAGLDLAGLARAEDLGIVTVSPYRVEFTHPLVASAVYATIPAGERRRLHTLVADSLSPGDRDRRAWHRSEAALGLDDAVARELDDVGARASARGAFAVASSAHERAATLSEDAASRARRFFAAGEAAWLAGEDARAPALLDEAARHAPDAGQRARAHAMAGQVAARGGSLTQARDLLLSAAGDAESDAPDEAMLMYAAAVDACFYLLDSGSARAVAERLSDLGARTGGDPSRRAAAVAAIAVGMARVIAGEPGMQELRAGVDALAIRQDPSPFYADFAVAGLLYLREVGASRDLLRETIETRRRNSELGQLPHLLFHLARGDATTDRWAWAEAGYSEAVGLAREFGQLTELGASLAGLAALYSRQGRVEECHQHAAEAVRVGEGRDLNLAAAWADFARAELELSLGEVDSAIEGFTALEQRLDDLGVGDPDLSSGPELVEALLRKGNRARATEVQVAFQARARHKGLPWSLARAARATALLGSDDEIDDLFGLALTLHGDGHGEGDDAFERARTLMLHGARLRRARRRVDARVPLQQARATFDALGARRWSDVVSAELEATGLTARARTAGPVVDLTARELQIAELLAEGRTTRETAAALFLSPKTVEYHLRHIYTKLDITSRAELKDHLGAVTT
ncbi:putative transcriptional regulator [Janibacter sp. HTCC2649]|nr:putative transcriptional regulator [Janibacter sp. HTCC2649]